MDSTVGSIGEVITAALESEGYNQSTIGQYKKVFRELAMLAENYDGFYSEEIGAEYSEAVSGRLTDHYCENMRMSRRRIVRIFDLFIATGIVYLVPYRASNMIVEPESLELFDLLRSWEVEMARRELAVSTRNYYGRLAREYLVFLESKGLSSLEYADGAGILEFLGYLKVKWLKTSTYSIVTNFRPFLRFLGRQDLADALGMANAKREHRIVPMLDDADEDAVVSTCCDRLVPARDAAITLLALTTGLRACDIIALKLGDVNWRAMTIGIVQQKTGNPITLPMLPPVANAIADYLLGERPDADDSHLFLRSLAPFQPFSDHAGIYSVTRRVFTVAGIADTHGGTRLLRHNAASKMLRTGSPLPTISAVLGHASSDTTSIYLEADFERMRDCVLPLPKGALA